MKLISRIMLFVLLALVVVLALPSPVAAQPLGDDKVVFGDTYRLLSGDTLSGNLLIVGGTVTLESDSTVTGDVAILGGTLDILGSVNGNVNAMGGTVFLGDTARVNGDVTSLGATIHQADNAVIGGRLVTGGLRPFDIHVPGSIFDRGLFSLNFTPIWGILRFFGNIIVLAALAMLVVLLFPNATRRVSNAVTDQPAISGGIGLLTVAVLPALLVILLITIILSPVSILGVVLLAVALVFGWVAIGLEVGRRFLQLFKAEGTPALAAGLGTLLLSFVTFAIAEIPCVGWVIMAVLGLIGLGGVIVTRFGTQVYPPGGFPVAVAAGPLTVAPLAPVIPIAPVAPAVYPAPAAPAVPVQFAAMDAPPSFTAPTGLAATTAAAEPAPEPPAPVAPAAPAASAAAAEPEESGPTGEPPSNPS